DRLITRQRARGPIRRIACNVRGGMQNKRWATIGSLRNRLLLIAGNLRVTMMPWHLIGIGPSVAGAECQNGGERDDGSHQHGLCPLSTQPLSTENAAGFRPESQVCHIRA